MDLSNFDTSNTLSMTSMFESCTSLAYLDLSSFITQKCYEFSKMFEGDEGLIIFINEENNEKLIESLPSYVNYTNNENIF